jgi:hypothetical protein
MDDPFDDYDNDNLMDEDGALDYILYQDMEKSGGSKPAGGCLSVFILLLIPPVLIIFL